MKLGEEPLRSARKTGSPTQCQTTACVVPSTASPATAAGHPLSLSLFGDVSGVHSSSTRSSEADREGLVKKFEKLTGVALCPSLLPALSLLQIVFSQCKAKSWARIPWRRMLSEELSLARRSHKRRDMSEIVAEAAGLCGEEWVDTSVCPSQRLRHGFWWAFELLDGLCP